MIEWFGSLTTEQQMYTGLALVASATVLFQLAAMMVGVGAEELMAAGDYDLDGAEDHPSGLGLISGRTVSAFFVGFGWAGFLLTNEGRTGFAPAALATLVGFGFAWSLVRLMRFLHGLRHSGSLDYRNALGETGTVYLEIHPALATGGQVEVMVQGRLRTVQALTAGLAPIARGTRVEVVDLMDPTTLIVAPVEEEEKENNAWNT